MVRTISAKNATEQFVSGKINELGKKLAESKSSRITLTNNEIKDTIEAIKSLENRRILLKRTTERL